MVASSKPLLHPYDLLKGIAYDISVFVITDSQAKVFREAGALDSNISITKAERVLESGQLALLFYLRDGYVHARQENVRWHICQVRYLNPIGAPARICKLFSNPKELKGVKGLTTKHLATFLSFLDYEALIGKIIHQGKKAASKIRVAGTRTTSTEAKALEAHQLAMESVATFLVENLKQGSRNASICDVGVDELLSLLRDDLVESKKSAGEPMQKKAPKSKGKGKAREEGSEEEDVEEADEEDAGGEDDDVKDSKTKKAGRGRGETASWKNAVSKPKLVTNKKGKGKASHTPATTALAEGALKAKIQAPRKAKASGKGVTSATTRDVATADDVPETRSSAATEATTYLGPMTVRLTNGDQGSGLMERELASNKMVPESSLLARGDYQLFNMQMDEVRKPVDAVDSSKKTNASMAGKAKRGSLKRTSISNDEDEGLLPLQPFPSPSRSSGATVSPQRNREPVASGRQMTGKAKWEQEELVSRKASGADREEENDGTVDRGENENPIQQKKKSYNSLRIDSDMDMDIAVSSVNQPGAEDEDVEMGDNEGLATFVGKKKNVIESDSDDDVKAAYVGKKKKVIMMESESDDDDNNNAARSLLVNQPSLASPFRESSGAACASALASGSGTTLGRPKRRTPDGPPVNYRTYGRRSK